MAEWWAEKFHTTPNDPSFKKQRLSDLWVLYYKDLRERREVMKKAIKEGRGDRFELQKGIESISQTLGDFEAIDDWDDWDDDEDDSEEE